MDYILFYSEYSRSCQYLIQQFPDLIKKSVSIDSIGIQDYLKKLKIVSVPTLLIVLESPVKTSIVDRIVGYEDIYNWFITTLYRMNQVEFHDQNQTEQNYPETITETDTYNPQPPQPQHTQTFEQPESTTNLDTLYLEDLEHTEGEQQQTQEQEQHTAVKTGVSTMKLAEEMKRAREQNK
jgi:hypothetical protein